jgi:hypothetical protein
MPDSTGQSEGLRTSKIGPQDSKNPRLLDQVRNVKARGVLENENNLSC